MTTLIYSGVTESVSVTATAADTSANLLYSCPNNHDAEVVFLFVTNGDATQEINIQFYHADTDEWHYISRSHSLAGKTTYNVLETSSIFLHAGDKIAVYKGGGTIDATLSAKQYFNPSRN
tara:strand:+ start:1663 stop:2022 length:360 start_codon:yes stop_codon:yes gene_type:complete